MSNATSSNAKSIKDSKRSAFNMKSALVKSVGSFELREYQTNAIFQIFHHFSLSSSPITLAVAPSGGKTVSSIAVAETYLERKMGKRVLVLAHGTNVLKTQYANDIESVNPKFTRKMVNHQSEIDKSQVIVTIPQSLKRKVDLPQFDLLIIDEAHQFYFAKMVQSLIAHIKPKHILLLTGTPSAMIRAGMPILPTPLSVILNEGLASDLRVMLCKTPYRFTQADYNKTNELKTSVQFSKSDTVKTLEEVSAQLMAKAEDKSWKALTRRHDKVMIACRNQDQARIVSQYMNAHKIDCALSTSDTDSGNTEIARFRTESNCKVLVVVGRGVLGFNMLELEVVVDMTASQNIDRIYQLMARVVRKAPDDRKKYFVKISSKDMYDYMGHVMTAVFCLTQDEWFTKFNGINFLDLPIPTLKANPRDDRDSSTGGDLRTPSTRPIYDMSQMGPPILNLFKDIFSKNDYSFTTLARVRSVCFGGKTVWTKEDILADAKKFRTRSEWQNKSKAAYSAASRMGILEEATAHMVELKKENGHWTYERCKKKSMQFKTRKEWYENSRSSYTRAQKKGWLQELTAHMASVVIWGKEACRVDALRFTSRTEWKKKSGSAYKAAVINGWLDELCTHMDEKKVNWTLNLCKTDAEKYQTIKEWKEASYNAYKAAQRNGWLPLVTTHMVRSKRKQAA